MKKLIGKLFTAAGILKKFGMSGVKRKLISKSWEKREKQRAERWLELHGSLTDNDRDEIRQKIENFSYKPLISIITPVYDVEEKYLRLTIESVLKQLYQNWELCLADDCSPSPHVTRVLEEYAAKDKRVKVVFRETNGHISAASNTALELAAGEFAALLDHDDELSEDALFFVVKELNDFPAADMLYSDEDTIDENSKRSAPKFKPDWSQDLFYSVNYITHLAVYRMEIIRRIGGFRRGFEGSQDYDLALRVIEEIPEEHIRHVPRILYHWRAIKGSVALSGDEKPYAHERAREALRSHFERTGKTASVSPTVYNLHRVRYNLPLNQPKVSVIFLAGDDDKVAEWTEGLLRDTIYQNYEIIMVASRGENGPITDPRFRVIVCDHKSDAEKYNFAASQTDADILCFIDRNLDPLNDDWLEELTAFALQDEIGVAGPKLLNNDGSILHAGYLVGVGGLAGSAHQGFSRDSGGYFLRTLLTNNYSAISVSCMAVRRKLFLSAGGFDGANLPNALFDVDFCLRLRERGYRIVFTPYAELISSEKNVKLNGQKPANLPEIEYFSSKWSKYLKKDPFYNPNLSKKDGSFSLEI
jgi:glycosyltransferase involved in cell wall biosynthesis